MLQKALIATYHGRDADTITISHGLAPAFHGCSAWGRWTIWATDKAGCWPCSSLAFEPTGAEYISQRSSGGGLGGVAVPIGEKRWCIRAL